MKNGVDDNVGGMKNTTAIVADYVLCKHNNFDTTAIHNITLVNNNIASNDEVPANSSFFPIIDGEFTVFQLADQDGDVYNHDGYLVDKNNEVIAGNNNNKDEIDEIIEGIDNSNVDEIDEIIEGIDNNKPD